MPSQNPIRDSCGRPVVLGREIGRGGEGTIREIATDSRLVAKLYHHPVAPEKAAKLEEMVRITDASLLAIAAWPQNLLYIGKDVCGFVMRRLSGYREVHQLYGPAYRKVYYPSADWSFLVLTARNLASAIESIHGHNHVIGDLNEGNVEVSQDARIHLIDCDSFQLQIGGRLFPCEVGVANFTPPELQKRSLRGVLRTANHDNFGLAVLIFHLLFMGRHPFAGRFLASGDMPIERAIHEYRFAFGRNASRVQMAPPPFAPPLLLASDHVAELFERAFSSAGASNMVRPSASQWKTALDLLRTELKSCPNYAAHKFHRSLTRCPWCEIEHSGGPNFFISVVAAASRASNFDFDDVWQSITSIAPPSEPNISLERIQIAPTPLSRGQKITRYANRAAAVGTLTGAIGAAVGYWSVSILVVAILWLALANITPYGRERQKRRSALRHKERNWKFRLEKCQTDHSARVAVFTKKRVELEQAHDRYKDLLRRSAADMERLKANRRATQLHQFLSRYFIEDARISGIGPSLKAKLRSWNIETASDLTISTLNSVQGFGPTRIKALLNWRKTLEQKFHFDPDKAVLPSEIALVDQKYSQEKNHLEQLLRPGAEELIRLKNYDATENSICESELKKMAADIAQLKAAASQFTWW